MEGPWLDGVGWLDKGVLAGWKSAGERTGVGWMERHWLAGEMGA